MNSDLDPAARLLLGDCIAVMAEMDAESIDAVVCDPPYGLEFMGKDWDSFRGGAGFMKLGFDAREDARGVLTFGKGLAAMRAFQDWTRAWGTEALRVLKPGGHALAFGGTRTYHRLGCGLEDAGFEIRDSLHWIYGSGFPKSLNVSKAIDGAAGVEREVIGQVVGIDRPGFAGENYSKEPGTAAAQKTYDVTAATSDEAKLWDGWGTGLKPAHEPIVLARKPLAGTVAETVLAHGTGALNIDASRPGGEPESRAVERPKGSTGGVTSFPMSATVREPVDAGRWPANLLLAHLPECEGNGASNTDVLCAAGCPVAELNEASGESVSAPRPAGEYERSGRSGGILGEPTTITRNREVAWPGDRGGAARFFYIAKPRTRERIGGTVRNLHPTVKPVDLMRHLVRLVTPPDGVVLDPFLGSGSTGCAAMAEGFRFIGIERDPESYETALARVSDWAFAHGRGPVTG